LLLLLIVDLTHFIFSSKQYALRYYDIVGGGAVAGGGGGGVGGVFADVAAGVTVI
jgi:hypothetical protein